MISPDIVLFFLGMFAIFYCWEKAIHAKHIIVIDKRRMELYRLRDRLHELVVTGEISDSSKEYTITVRFLHSIIDIQKEADFLFFCQLIMSAVKETRSESHNLHRIKHKEVLKIVFEATGILLEAIRSNSFFVRYLLRCSPKKLDNDKNVIYRYKPVQTYRSVKDFNELMPSFSRAKVYNA